VGGLERRVEIWADASGAWRWRVKAENNRIVAESGESFWSKWGAERAVPGEFDELPRKEVVTLHGEGDEPVEVELDPAHLRLDAEKQRVEPDS
jgi:uncharacterized protein YegP (UPF0339 family)